MTTYRTSNNQNKVIQTNQRSHDDIGMGYQPGGQYGAWSSDVSGRMCIAWYTVTRASPGQDPRASCSMCSGAIHEQHAFRVQYLQDWHPREEEQTPRARTQ